MCKQYDPIADSSENVQWNEKQATAKNIIPLFDLLLTKST